MPGRCARRSGFTLIELIVVMAIIALIMTVAIPRMAPMLAFGQLDSSARHLANYGLSLNSYCAMRQESVTFVVDFDKREYYTLRWIEETNKLFDDKGEKDHKLFDSSTTTKSDTGNDTAGAPTTIDTNVLLQMGSQEKLSEDMLRIKEQFNRSFLHALEAQARTASKTNSVLSDVGPLFDKDFKLKDDENQNRQEVSSPLLDRTSIPADVTLESVRVGSTEYKQGVAEIQVDPLGMNQFVVFTLKDSGGEYVTVTWDPITGNAHLHRGMEIPTDTGEV